MSGNFARGFMETFPTSFAMASKRKQDAWDKTWDKWNQREELDRKARNDFEKIYNRANVIVDHFGQGNAPEGAASYLAAKMMEGLTDEEAKKLAQEGKWTASELPAGQVNPDRTEQSQVNQQTDAVMGLNQPQMPQQEPQGLLGGLVSGGKSFLQNLRLSPEEKALQDFAKEQGITVDQLKQRLGNGAVSIVSEEQQANAQQAQRFSAQMPAKPQVNPNSIWNQLGENESQILLKAMEKTQASTNRIESSKASLKIVAKMTSDNIDLVKDNPAITSTLVKGGVTLFSKGVNEMNALLSVVGTEDNARLVIKDPALVKSKIEELNQQIKDVENSPVIGGAEKIARAAALFDMRVRLSAYTLAESYQQSGRSLSNEERRIFEEILSGGLSPDKYFTNMQALMNIQMQRLQFDSGALANDVFIQQGSKIAPDVIRVPNGNILEDADVAGTSLQQDFEKILGYNDGLTSTTQPAQSTTTRLTPPQAAIEYLMKNPNLKDAFIQKYGVENLPQGF